ncbi:hypothetical protein ACYZX9_01490 [Sphingomonas citri]
MGTPAPPDEDGQGPLYGVWGRRINLAVFATALALTLSGATAAQRLHLPGTGEPAITAQTQRSGGVRPPEQAAIRLVSAELWFELDPMRRALTARARLVVRASATVPRLLLDLDSNYAVRSVRVDGRVLPATSVERPDGQLALREARAPTSITRGLGRSTRCGG